jgi:hypothetical protein
VLDPCDVLGGPVSRLRRVGRAARFGSRSPGAASPAGLSRRVSRASWMVRKIALEPPRHSRGSRGDDDLIDRLGCNRPLDGRQGVGLESTALMRASGRPAARVAVGPRRSNHGARVSRSRRGYELARSNVPARRNLFEHTRCCGCAVRYYKDALARMRQVVPGLWPPSSARQACQPGADFCR